MLRGNEPKKELGDDKATTMSDEEASRRLSNYNRDGAFGAALAQTWRLAGAIIFDTYRQVSLAIVERSKKGSTELSRFHTDTIMERSLRSIQARFEGPVDIAWVKDIAASAVDLDRQSVPMSAMVRGKTEITIRTVACIREEISDPAIVAEITNTLWMLLAFETEILVWQVGELRRLAAASERTEKSDDFHRKVSESLVVALRDSRSLHQLTQKTIASTSESLGQIAEVALAANQSAEAMNSAARTATGLRDVIGELTTDLDEAAGITLLAADQMDCAVESTHSLSDQIKEIASIVGLIRDIAGQTNLLALNATIEAARAGDAGRGFAVVANEVKSLASQTAGATDAIAGKMNAIQSANRESVESVVSVQKTIAQVRAAAQRMAENVAGQGLQVSHIAQAVDETAVSAVNMSRLIESIADRTKATVDEVVQLAEGFDRVDHHLSEMDATTSNFVSVITEQGN